MTQKNKVQLITYPNSMGENLPELHYAMKRYLSKAIGGVHILPFYPSSADRGFSPLTYLEVDPAYGTWTDIEKIGKDFELVVDFMVNHISKQSEYFQDYIEKGADSEYADMFLSFNKLSPNGQISDADLDLVYTRKPRPPYSIIERADGSREKIWTTFNYEQIDLDFYSNKTREVMRKHLIHIARSNVNMVRMDAFAYTTIKIGTNCFFLEPDVWEILEWLDEFVGAFDVQILPEVHEHYSYQMKIAEKGYWVYDFALPMLVLHALFCNTNKNLLHWLKICPRKQITTLDTHDGIGVVDVEELMTQDEIDSTIDNLYKRGSNIKPIYSSSDYQNLDVYQVNCTYYSALGSNDDAYIAARTIQFFTPGIPQVYYVGLLAGENDIELVEKTLNGRDINRHNYTLDEIKKEVEKGVVKRLLKLMEFRNNYPGFNGVMTMGDCPDHQLRLTWTKGSYQTTAHIDLKTYRTTIYYYDFTLKIINQFTA